ncbi:MAG: protein kinase [Planctomycetes bacterium]|nr:protein kinase [Planctomycetota bacterium]
MGRFEVDGPLARGGAGQVLRGRDPATGAPVAIKLLIEAADPGAPRRARFEREAEVLRRIQHPNVIGLREAGEVGGRPFVVLDYVDGETLEASLRRGPLEPDAAARLVRTLARAVAAAHALPR